MQEVESKEPVRRRADRALSDAKTFRPKQRADVRSRRIDGETVVLDRREEFIHQFNRTASYIWEHCDGRHTTEEISSALCAEFEVDFPTAEKDVLFTVEQLRRAKLLAEP